MRDPLGGTFTPLKTLRGRLPAIKPPTDDLPPTHLLTQTPRQPSVALIFLVLDSHPRDPLPAVSSLERAATSPALFNRCLLDWFRDWSDQAFYIPVVYGQLAIPPVHQTAIMNAFGCGSHVHVRSKSPLKA
ncbi:hypothetical protein PCANC_18787 [Puccinia coronata f. sp. avenae]|uniref:Uncharacterized protein n=1 Tax=Puccinia coronata f. sp. avenae TaxID=200324 RepID=A0A2N5SD53_9BASI|nr:hypothetical protein PCANC_18787 [Puccinia coronata f. sp. avenae]